MTAPPRSDRDFDALVEHAFVDEECLRAAWHAAGRLAGEIEAIERSAASPREALPALCAALGRAGLLGLVARAEDGGRFAAIRSVALCLARERLAWISPLADLAFAMQALSGYPIAWRGSTALRRRWLPRVIDGSAVGAFALTEPGAGSDLDGIETQAVREATGWRLRGCKTFISNAGLAAFYVVFAAHRPRGERRRLTAFVVEADARGLRVEPIEVLGGHPIGTVYLDEVVVSDEARLGEPGDGLGIALGTLTRLRPTVGAAAVGFAQRALDEAVRHVGSREQFGGPLSRLQAVRMRLADMACDVEAARLLVYRAARRADGADPDDPTARDEIARTAAMAKLVATEAAQRVVDHAVQLHGGLGVTRGHAVARLYEEVRALRIYEGTSDVQRLLIARGLGLD